MTDAGVATKDAGAAAGWMTGRELIRVPLQTRPILSVVIHTEEEFDWGKPHDRRATSVEHMRHIGRAQSLFDEHACLAALRDAPTRFPQYRAVLEGIDGACPR